MVKIKETYKLSKRTKNQIDKAVKSAFGDIPIVQEITWSQPDFTITFTEEKELISFYNVVKRDVSFDRKKVTVAGINNVITLPEFRGKGYSSKLLSATRYFLFNELAVDYGLLLCAKELIPFYKKLGWYKVDSSVFFKQPVNKTMQWGAETMLLSNMETKNYPKEIDLNGFPW